MVATVNPMSRDKKEATSTVRLVKTLVKRVNRIAAHRDQSVPDYLAERLAAIIDADEAAMLADLQRERGAPAAAPAKPKK
jgi:predicted transcriptional regulator